MRNSHWICLILLLSLSWDVSATSGLSAFKITTLEDGSQEYSLTLQVLALMTSLSFLLPIVIMMTSFTRIVIVLAILRQALVVQSPSNQVIIGISYVLSFL